MGENNKVGLDGIISLTPTKNNDPEARTVRSGIDFFPFG